VAIVSYRAWQDLFGGAEDIVGRSIAVNNQPATVIGVAPPDFRGTMLAERTDVWLPLLQYWSSFPPDTRRRWMTDRSETPVDLIGRLRPGQSVAAAQADFTTMEARLNRSYPVAERPRIAVVRYAADSRRCGARDRADVPRALLDRHAAHGVGRIGERRESHVVASRRPPTRDRCPSVAGRIALQDRALAAG
jgi:hypothetical protein